MYVCMPFAGYKDFADCENQNKDKGDTGAYCGAIQNKVEEYDSGSYLEPSPMEGDSSGIDHRRHDLLMTNNGVYCKTCGVMAYPYNDPNDPDNQFGQMVNEVNGSDWTHMTQEQRRNAILAGNVNLEEDNSLHLIAGKNWTDLTPLTQHELESIEARTYKDLSF